MNTKNLSAITFVLLFSLSSFHLLAEAVIGGPAAQVLFSLDECVSYNNGTNMDYSEFTGVVTNNPDLNLSVVGGHLYRTNPQTNKHSCTPGLNNTDGMCVGYDSGCDYVAGSDRSVKIDIELNPLNSQSATLSGLSFYEKSPEMFDWIDGPSGLNNYPEFYGVRVLVDGNVIFEQSQIATTQEWTLQNYDFSGLAGFTVSEATVFNFELLAYCPVGSFAMQSVWDLEQILITANCEAASVCEFNGQVYQPNGATVSLTNGATEYLGCVGDINLEVSNTSSDQANYYYVITDNLDNVLAFVNATTTSELDLSGASAGECHIWGWNQVGLADPVPGQNILLLNDEGCEAISSNFIRVTRVETQGGTLTGGPFEFCVDGVTDNVTGIELNGNSGANSAWVITDPQGNILGLPPMPSAVDFDGAGAGVCLVWNISYEDGLTGLAMGNNVSVLDGCFDLSNSISVTRVEAQGGTLTGGPFEFCVDGVADNVSGIELNGNSGANSAWVITDPQGNILGLPPMPSAVDFDGAGAGVCLIWHISYEDGLTGLAMGNNVSVLDGCFDLSNSISVTRVEAQGGTLTGGPFEFCVDGVADNVSGIELNGNSGANSAWVITDPQGNILGLPPMPSVVDFDGAGAGVCLIWNISYEDGLTGLAMGNNVSGLDGCFGLSNSISVTRVEPQGGTLEGGPFNFVVDGMPDMVSGITLNGNSGANTAWVITDPQGNILGLPPMPGVVDFDAAGAGVCLIWNISYEDGLTGLAMGNNVSVLDGCFDLSNSITVTRTLLNGGVLTGGPFEFCVDGVTDNVSGIDLSGASGANNAWVITDPQGNILGLPPMPGVVDFDGAGAGVCLIWNISYENGLTGLDMGNNVSQLMGQYALSNSISVTRVEPLGGTLTGGPFEFCVDGVADNVSGIELNGNSGANSAWVITDPQGNILGLPPMPSAVDFDGAGAGVCLIWNISYENGLTGLAMGNNVSVLDGCFDLSNSISVTRVEAQGGTLTGGPFEFCVDGVSDNVSGIELNGNSGANSAWVITDPQGNILGLPPMPSVVDFDGAGAGVCLIWNISYEDGLTGLAMGNNVSVLDGCFGLSNSISVTRVEPQGGTLEGGPFNFVVDGVPDMVSGITLNGNSGANTAWVITDPQGNILGLPPMPGVVDFDAAGAGVCLIWNISYEDGLTGLEMGNNVSILDGCFDLSNSITVTRTLLNGGVLTGGPFEFCVDGVTDNVSGIDLSGASGANNAWVITDPQGNILGLPPMPGVVDFDAAGAGVCLIWNISYENGLTGLDMGNNVSQLMGQYALSNSISVTRVEPLGGTLTGGPFEFCVDGVADNVSGIELNGNSGANSAWVITDPQGNILGLPPMPSVVDFDGAGAGVCLIWNISYEDGLTGLAMGNNVSVLDGCFGLSNSISVTRVEPQGGILEGGPFNFVVDGVPDMVSGITLNGNSGANTAWVITDPQGNILGLPPMPGVVDFDAAGAGVCLIWNISYEDGLTGLEMGNNVSILDGCFDLSNSITVTRTLLNGGVLTGGPFEFCVDGVTDNVSGIDLSGASGANNAWVITDPQGNILGLPPMPGVVDFDVAGAGVCLIWNISYENGLTGLDMGNNVSQLMGQYALSNSISVTRVEPQGGTLTGGPFEFCVDGVADNVSGITLNGNSAANSDWVITDPQGNILGLPPMPGVVDFDAAGEGVCLIWNISYEDGLAGLAMGNNVSGLDGCFDLSNSITVTREICAMDSIVINEFSDNEKFELKNVGTTSIDISNYWICNFPSYGQLNALQIDCGGDLILDPGELITFVANFDIDAADGELGLYTNDQFGNSNSIIDYVEWGSTGHTRSDVAVLASIWTTGDFVASFTSGMSLEYDGLGNASMDWMEDNMTLCADNTLIGGPDDIGLEFKAYPNPTNSIISLEFLKLPQDNGSIMIFDAFGKLMTSKTDQLSKQYVLQLNVEEYPTGIYFVKVVSKNHSYIKQFLKID